MHGRDFLWLARVLVARNEEAAWRTAVSRAYYAAFHTARVLLAGCGFDVPRSDQAHAYLWLRLDNSGHEELRTAGDALQLLRQNRNWAGYDMHRPYHQAAALAQILSASTVIETLEKATTGPTKSPITEAIKIYERDVLKTVTWRP